MDMFTNLIRKILIIIAIVISLFLLAVVYLDVTEFYNPYFPYISRHTLGVTCANIALILLIWKYYHRFYP